MDERIEAVVLNEIPESQQVTDSETVTESDQARETTLEPPRKSSDQGRETAQAIGAEKKKLTRPRSSSAKRKPQEKGKAKERANEPQGEGEEPRAEREQVVAGRPASGVRPKTEQASVLNAEQIGPHRERANTQQGEEELSKATEPEKVVSGRLAGSGVRSGAGKPAVLTAEQLRQHTERITGPQPQDLAALHASPRRPSSPGLSSNVSVRQLRSLFEQSKSGGVRTAGAVGPVRKASKTSKSSKSAASSGSGGGGGNANAKAVRRAGSSGATTDTDSSDALGSSGNPYPNAASGRMKRDGSLRTGSVLGPAGRSSPRRKGQSAGGNLGSAGSNLGKSPRALKSQVQKRQQGKQALQGRPNFSCEVPTSASRGEEDGCGLGEIGSRLDEECLGNDVASCREAGGEESEEDRGLECGACGNGEGNSSSKGRRATGKGKQAYGVVTLSSEAVEMDTDGEGHGGERQQLGVTLNSLEGEEDVSAGETVVLVIGSGNTGLTSGVVMTPGRTRRKREGGRTGGRGRGGGAGMGQGRVRGTVGERIRQLEIAAASAAAAAGVGRGAVAGRKGRGGAAVVATAAAAAAAAAAAGGRVNARREWGPKGRKAVGLAAGETGGGSSSGK
ncbi:unnamed protein product, partial [Closterium sp. NIES-54]